MKSHTSSFFNTIKEEEKYRFNRRFSKYSNEINRDTRKFIDCISAVNDPELSEEARSIQEAAYQISEDAAEGLVTVTEELSKVVDKIKSKGDNVASKLRKPAQELAFSLIHAAKVSNDVKVMRSADEFASKAIDL